MGQVLCAIMMAGGIVLMISLKMREKKRMR